MDSHGVSKVVVTKSKNDEKIKTHLENIQQILPRLERWKKAYEEKEMQQVVLNTYIAVINFSRAAVEYFSHFWKRILSSAIPSVMERFDEAAKLIYVTLAKVNAEANQSLHERSQRMEKILLSMEKRFDVLQATMNVQEQQADEENFANFESLLRVSFFGLDKANTIDQCAKLTWISPTWPSTSQGAI